MSKQPILVMKKLVIEGLSGRRWKPIVKGVDLTLFDVIGIAAALGMFLILITRSAGNLRELARLEPPGVRRD